MWSYSVTSYLSVPLSLYNNTAKIDVYNIYNIYLSVVLSLY